MIMSHVTVTEMPMSHVEFKKRQCRPVTKSPCRMSNLKNGHVTLSILSAIAIPQRLTFALPIPTCWYLKSLEDPTPTLEHPTPTPAANRADLKLDTEGRHPDRGAHLIFNSAYRTCMILFFLPTFSCNWVKCA